MQGCPARQGVHPELAIAELGLLIRLVGTSTTERFRRGERNFLESDPLNRLVPLLDVPKRNEKRPRTTRSQILRKRKKKKIRWATPTTT